MQVRYVYLGGKEIDPHSIQQGSTFLAEVWLSFKRTGQSSNTMALSQIFPSGWEILSTRYADNGSSSNESPYEYRDIKDDRVNTFFSISSGEQVHYQVKINAAYAGTYNMPPVVVEDMYKTAILANSDSFIVEVFAREE